MSELKSAISGNPVGFAQDCTGALALVVTFVVVLNVPTLF